MTNDLVLSELVLEVTNACHFRCVHCSAFGGSALPDELTQEEKLRVVSDACSLGMKELRLLGGDPLLRIQDTIELLAEANSRGVDRAHVCTSAVEKRLGWITSLKALAPIRVSADASIYSADACVHDAITMPGALELLLTSSREAVAVGFDLNWNFVWMKPNFDALPSVVRLASELGIKQVRVLRLMLNGRARENRNLLALPQEWEDRCGEILDTVHREFPSVQLAYSKPLCFRLRETGAGTVEPCGAGSGQLVVQADGSVIPCIGMKGMHYMEMGNVRKESLSDLCIRARSLRISTLSQQLDECPAVLYQNGGRFVQIKPKLQED